MVSNEMNPLLENLTFNLKVSGKEEKNRGELKLPYMDVQHDDKYI